MRNAQIFSRDRNDTKNRTRRSAKQSKRESLIQAPKTRGRGRAARQGWVPGRGRDPWRVERARQGRSRKGNGNEPARKRNRRNRGARVSGNQDDTKPLPPPPVRGMSSLVPDYAKRLPMAFASREARPRVLEGGRIMDTTCDIGTCGTRHFFRGPEPGGQEGGRIEGNAGRPSKLAKGGCAAAPPLSLSGRKRIRRSVMRLRVPTPAVRLRGRLSGKGGRGVSTLIDPSPRERNEMSRPSLRAQSE